jgi:Na+-driven multidrug efflux pump
MRGVQDTRRPLAYLLGANAASAVASPVLVYGLDLGVEGSAVANVVAQAAAAGLFVRALVRTGVPLRPSWPAMRAQLVVGRDLTVRTLSFQVAFLTAAAVAARMGTDRIAAHQIALQLWVFMALVLDSLAIAAQSLIGEHLGAGDREAARSCRGCSPTSRGSSTRRTSRGRGSRRCSPSGACCSRSTAC